jgi:hypothetical protein
MTDPDKIRQVLTELGSRSGVVLRLADGRERRGFYRGFDGSWVYIDDERIAADEVEGILIETESEGPE